MSNPYDDTPTTDPQQQQVQPYPMYAPSITQPYAGVEDPCYIGGANNKDSMYHQYPQPLGFGGLQNPYLPQQTSGASSSSSIQTQHHKEMRIQEEHVDLKGPTLHVDVVVHQVDLPTHSAATFNNNVDPVIKAETDNHIRTIPTSTVPATKVHQPEPTRRNSIHLTCPRIHCDCLLSCSDLSCPSFPKWSYMNRYTRVHLINLSIAALIFLISMVLLAISLVFFGIVGQDPTLLDDPNSLIYIHRNCCIIFDTPVSCSHSKYYSSRQCKYQVSFPVLGSSALTSDPQRGQNVVCSSNKTLGLITQNTYSYSSFDISSSQRVDCYTNKDESQVSLLPYSQTYADYYMAGIVCISIAGSFLFIIIVHLVTYLSVLYKKN